MKKIVLFMLSILMIVSLAGCGNTNIGFGNYTFAHVHFNDGVKGVCANVNSWHDNDIGCEVHTDEYGTLYLSEGTYILIEDGDKCPFCN